MLVKVIFLLIFFAVMVAVGLYSRKHATNVNDFVLGGRSVGPWLTAFAYGTSYFSAVVFVGYAGQFGYKYGISATWIGIGNAIIGSLLAWVILGRRTRVMSKHLSASTMPDYFGKRMIPMRFALWQQPFHSFSSFHILHLYTTDFQDYLVWLLIFRTQYVSLQWQC